jgi:hypothetical protein
MQSKPAQNPRKVKVRRYCLIGKLNVSRLQPLSRSSVYAIPVELTAPGGLRLFMPAAELAPAMVPLVSGPTTIDPMIINLLCKVVSVAWIRLLYVQRYCFLLN